jgi:uncharacterized protein with PIN domain
VRLYSNENFPLQVVQALRLLGHDVLTSLEAGKANQSTPDEEVLEFTTEQGRALLTINRRDFIALHERGLKHAGMIVCTQDADVQGQAERIHAAISTRRTLSGQLIRVDRPAK